MDTHADTRVAVAYSARTVSPFYRRTHVVFRTAARMFVSVVAVTCARCTRLAQHTARGRMSRPGTQNIFRVCLTTNSRRHNWQPHIRAPYSRKTPKHADDDAATHHRRATAPLHLMTSQRNPTLCHPIRGTTCSFVAMTTATCSKCCFVSNIYRIPGHRIQLHQKGRRRAA